MSSKVEQLVSRIKAIRDEFSDEEILEAVKILEERGEPSRVIKHLRDRKSLAEPKKAGHKRASSSSKALYEQRSKAVIGLEKTDRKKFDVLSEFDKLIRRGEVLPDISEIRKLGSKLSKDFPHSNSRKELISKLMKLLSELPIEKIREILQEAMTSSNIKGDDYRRFARFIISGE